MKKVQTTISNSKYLLIALFVAFSISCSTEDGEDGTPGATGATGQNGNANVQTYIYENPTWGEDYYMDLNTAFTDQEIENNVILGYLQLSSYDHITLSIPGNLQSYNFTNFIFDSTTSTENLRGAYRIVCYDVDFVAYPNPGLPEVESVKIVMIEGTNTTTTTGNGRVASRKEAVLNELKSANININNYQAVCDYYGIAN